MKRAALWLVFAAWACVGPAARAADLVDDDAIRADRETAARLARQASAPPDSAAESVFTPPKEAAPDDLAAARGRPSLTED